MQVDLSYSFKTAKEAFEHIFNGNKTVELHNSDSKKLDEEVLKFYNIIKEYNKKISDDNLQILPGNPYVYRGIVGCIGVKCAEIECGTFEENADKLALFTGWNYEVLKDPTLRRPLCSKAMVSLAMLGSMTGRW